jgi:arginyl-tRNA synthetase
VMAAAKALKTNPRELAAKVIEAVSLSEIAAKLEIAGPGFINVTLGHKFLADFLTKLYPANKFGTLTKVTQTIVVDLSSPNLAKEMHVGHLRSTVIGDALARISQYMGHIVIRQNHVGDWGTQFGMLIAYMQEQDILGDKSTTQGVEAFTVTDLEQFYRNAKQKFDTDPAFANKARDYVVMLQSGGTISANDEQYKSINRNWQIFRDESLRHCQKVYDKLHVNLTEKDVYGESRYNDKLSQIIKHLEEKHLITESNGARCVFFADGELPGGEETPFIVQKQDGGYLYSTTDLAAIDYRVHNLHADKIIYVVDARQAFHFKQLFIVGRKAGFANNDTWLLHSSFGTMMNEDGRPFKTRDGGTVKLTDLIDEAIIRARAMVEMRNPDWSATDKDELANILAIGAIKYADLSKNRTSDYIFSFDKMLAFDGNTAPYLLYAYTRIQSVLRRAVDTDVSEATFNIELTEISEHKLAVHIAKFPDMLTTTAEECYPHYLCQYLYNLSSLFMQFYEQCPILKANTPQMQKSRLALSSLTAQILQTGLNLLGIQTVGRM